MERIPEPAVLYLPGGRIAAVNGAAATLWDLEVVGGSMRELIARSTKRRADVSRLLQGDLPFARAVWSEVVSLGERADIVLPGMAIYRALVTSAPIVCDGKVVAAPPASHDFDANVRRRSGGLEVQDADTP